MLQRTDEPAFTFAALTVSDRGAAGERAVDGGGNAVVEMMRAAGFVQADRKVTKPDAQFPCSD